MSKAAKSTASCCACSKNGTPPALQSTLGIERADSFCTGVGAPAPPRTATDPSAQPQHGTRSHRRPQIQFTSLAQFSSRVELYRGRPVGLTSVQATCRALPCREYLWECQHECYRCGTNDICDVSAELVTKLVPCCSISTVYKAQCLETQETMIIKIYERAKMKPKHMQRLEREIRLMQQLAGSEGKIEVL